jgi:GNAT superfamily N-acetyltransferase
MDVQVYASNAVLPDHLRGQILALIRIHWAEVAGDWLGPEALPEEWQPSHVCAVAGDALLGYAGVVRRRLTHDGEALATYGLSSVYTFPFHRGTGLGSTVVRCATAEIAQAGDGDIALLFTMPELVPFYGRVGWSAMPGLTCLIGDPEHPVDYADLPMMLFLSARGERHRATLADGRLYVGVHPW